MALVGVENYNINDFNKLPGWENNKVGYRGVIYILAHVFVSIFLAVFVEGWSRAFPKVGQSYSNGVF